MSPSRQSINFHRRETRRFGIGPVFSLSWSAVVAGAFALLFGAVSFSGAYKQRQQAALLAEVQRQVAERTTAVDGLRRQLPPLKADAALEAEAGRLAVYVESLGALLDRMERGELHGQEGFSRYFEALARHVLPGVWLTGIRLEAGGKSIELAGAATLAEQVPQLVKALGQEDAFAAKAFAELNMRRPEGSAERIDFVLRTTLKVPDNHERR